MSNTKPKYLLTGFIDNCPTQPKLNHAVLAIGYGITKDGEKIGVYEDTSFCTKMLTINVVLPLMLHFHWFE